MVAGDQDLEAPAPGLTLRTAFKRPGDQHYPKR
jgi:hypothetical protein